MAASSKPDFIEMEHDILKLWEERRCFNKVREKNKGGKRFRFLDGPITANNPMGIHHAWGRSVKDIMLRYKAMNGFDCHYRNGFDTQGLWVEVEVEKELGFAGKRDIESYGVDNFTKKCVERITHFSRVIEGQSKRLGQWMDWDNSYYTHTDENITAIWHFLKICNEKGWIIKAHRPMPWCPRCGTSLSEHEMAGSYVDITHTAVFARAPVKNQPFDMLVWTTTPWTLAANAALAVNPGLEYVIAICGDGSQRPLVMAKNALKHIEGEKRVLRIVMGTELIGLEYETFFPLLPVQNGLTQKIIPWEEVSGEEGSGVVHIAPGCGTEDYDLGKKFSLPEICPIDENGVFTGEYGFLAGYASGDAAKLVLGKLYEDGKLFKAHEYTHSYPVCWRCKTEVLFRLVREWYIKTDEIRPKLIEAAETVKWEPAFIGKRMKSWLTDMGDWNISRKRYYGLPLPFYPCEDCGGLTVIGSKAELLALAGEKMDLPELHRPWIDSVTIKCPYCGALVSRIPEVGDVWLDAGIVPFSTLGYFSDKSEWEKNFPAEWVIEMQEQVRLWFYSQLFMSVVITGRAPYERVQTNNWVLAEDGTKFSKTGHMIRFEEASEKIGSDAIRYLFAGAPAASDMRFGFSLGEEARRKLLGFWNIYAFFITYAELDKPSISEISRRNIQNITDRWLVARTDSFIASAAKYYDSYNLAELTREFDACIDDVSNWYVRINRRRFWKDELDADKAEAYNALFHAIKTICQVMAPILPFMTEYIWQDMVLKYTDAEESVHLSQFPAAGGSTDMILLENTESVRAVITQALKLRNESSLKVKQPLAAMYLHSGMKQVCAPYEAIIKDELNIKEIEYLVDFAALNIEYLTINYQQAGRFLKSDLGKVKTTVDGTSENEMAKMVFEFNNGGPITVKGCGNPLPKELFVLQTKAKEHIAITCGDVCVAINTHITDDLRHEGIYREILRFCQVLRKEAGFAVSDRVVLDFETESAEAASVIESYKAEITRETLSEIKHIQTPLMQKELRINDYMLLIKIS